MTDTNETTVADDTEEVETPEVELTTDTDWEAEAKKARGIAQRLRTKVIKLIEKKFDTIWYLGTDYLGDELYERFLFHHGGFMEISLVGRIRCYFPEDKIEKMKKALEYALSKTTTSGSASHLIHQIKSGQKLISVKDSILINTELNKGIKKK